MKTIWKYPIPVQDLVKIEMPIASEPLCVQVQHGQPVIWALVHEDAKEVQIYRFAIFGTGHDVGLGRFKQDYLGTFQMNGGALVFHVFQIA